MSAELGQTLSWWWVLPFMGMLLSIALLPLTAGEWFHRHRNKAIVAAVFGVPVVLYLLLTGGSLGSEAVRTTAHDYVSFLVLLAALFTISGGIYLTGNLLGTPRTNVSFLLLGAVLANVIGTTGAAMVLIRPILRANSERKHTRHIVVFTIFVVCNVGGVLTPLGDPPLFLGFLQGIDFFWTLRLLPQWGLTVGLVLAVFLFFERYHYRRETIASLREDLADYVPMRIAGKINILFMLGVVGAVLASEPLARVGEAIHFPFVREAVMVAMMLLSLRFGPSGTRASNHFTWGPIVEVAIIFGGIFASMIPTLALLRTHGSAVGLAQPWQYFWASGVLSSFLDNAPTYLTFSSAAQGYLGLPNAAALMQQTVGAAGFAPAAFLAAISCGSVFMGANSYIGNAPNFMVKSVAEHSGMRMPSFFGYMAYSMAVLVPIFALTTFVFFR